MQFYLFIDKSHWIGALGPHGRGVTDHFNILPHSVDILMGTFTKSFGASGGYIAGCKSLNDLRGHGGPYAEAMTPPVLTHNVSSMASFMGVTPPLTLEIPFCTCNPNDKRSIIGLHGQQLYTSWHGTFFCTLNVALPPFLTVRQIRSTRAHLPTGI